MASTTFAQCTRIGIAATSITTTVSAPSLVWLQLHWCCTAAWSFFSGPHLYVSEEGSFSDEAFSDSSLLEPVWFGKEEPLSRQSSSPKPPYISEQYLLLFRPGVVAQGMFCLYFRWRTGQY